MDEILIVCEKKCEQERQWRDEWERESPLVDDVVSEGGEHIIGTVRDSVTDSELQHL